MEWYWWVLIYLAFNVLFLVGWSRWQRMMKAQDEIISKALGDAFSDVVGRGYDRSKLDACMTYDEGDPCICPECGERPGDCTCKEAA